MNTVVEVEKNYHRHVNRCCEDLSVFKGLICLSTSGNYTQVEILTWNS